MPAPMYFYPFNDPVFDPGFGPDGFRRNMLSTDSLHAISPTFSKRTLTLQLKSRAHYKYYWSLPEGRSQTFADYTSPDHRIYVLGHGEKGKGNIYAVAKGIPKPGQICSSKDLSDRLEAHGLPVGSQAHIRIHACDSATRSNTQTQGPDGNLLQNPCFADLFWAEISKTHEDVTVRGYDQTMGPYIIARIGSTVFTGANAHHFDYFKNDNWTQVQPGKIPKNRRGG
jgi:hypothetical protein